MTCLVRKPDNVCARLSTAKGSPIPAVHCNCMENASRGVQKKIPRSMSFEHVSNTIVCFCLIIGPNMSTLVRFDRSSSALPQKFQGI